MSEPASWVLKAIEDEAMRRARQEVTNEIMQTVTIAGLSARQVLALRRFYVERTGKDPTAL